MEGLQNGKVLIICGRTDTTIIMDDLVEDASLYLDGNVEFRYLDSGHEFPVTKSDDVAAQIAEFWSL